MTTTIRRTRQEPSAPRPWSWWAQAKRRCLGIDTPSADNDICADNDRRHSTDRYGGGGEDKADAGDQAALSLLPPEMVELIVEHCAVDTLVRLQRTSRSLNTVASRALVRRRDQVMMTIGPRLLPWMAGHFFADDADAVGVLLMTGGMGDKMCFSRGDDCPFSFAAILAGDRPFDCEIHFGGAFFTMSPVALAVWTGAVRVLTLLAGTRIGRGHSRQRLLGAVAWAAESACRRGRAYPMGAVIEVVLAMTAPVGLLRSLLERQQQPDEPSLVSLLRTAQQVATMTALTVDPFKMRASSADVGAMAAAVGASPWQLDRLIDRACGSAAYGARDRVGALYLVLAAAREVELVRGVRALVGAGLGPDSRLSAWGPTVREAFFQLVSQDQSDDAPHDDHVVSIAHAALALLVMILCDASVGSA